MKVNMESGATTSTAKRISITCLKLVIVLLFSFLFYTAWANNDFKNMMPVRKLFPDSFSAYYKYLDVNKGKDFIISKDSGVDSDSKDHNFFVTTCFATYSINGVNIDVKDDGSIVIQGFNSGDTFSIFLNENANEIPDGTYYFNINTDSKGTNPGVYFQWNEDITSTGGTRIVAVGTAGKLKCNTQARYSCFMVIPAGLDISEGVIFRPVLIQNQSDSTLSLTDEYKNVKNISYLRDIHPDSDQKSGKVFSISKTDFLSLTAKERRFFINNVHYMYVPHYTYVSVLFKDGTGLQFYSKDTSSALYGQMDAAGVLVGKTLKIKLQTMKSLPDKAQIN